MKAIQQDDIFDAQFKNKPLRFYYDNKVVKAKNRMEAKELFLKNYKIELSEEDVTNDKTKMIIVSFKNEDVCKKYIINYKETEFVGWEEGSNFLCFFNGIYLEKFSETEIKKQKPILKL